MSLNLKAYSIRYSNNILRMASYFEPYIMHFIEINNMSCIPWLLYIMYSMAKTCLYLYKTKYQVNIKSCALIYFIVFEYGILILQKDKYIFGRIGLYFWGFWEKLNYFLGFGERRQILLGRQGHNLHGDGEINALFSGIKGAQTPPQGGGGLTGGSLTDCRLIL